MWAGELGRTTYRDQSEHMCQDQASGRLSTLVGKGRETCVRMLNVFNLENTEENNGM